MSDFVFAGGKNAGRRTQSIEKGNNGWQVLIVDDDEDVHAVTRLALGDVTFRGLPLTCHSAYSAKEAREILSTSSDIGLVLLDVVMETDDAGLVLSRWIREDLKNNLIRIVLRTGQPGEAPEKHVIQSYDINDYKNKTELTSEKLFTTVISALRSYCDMRTIERNRQGLRRIIESSDSLFKLSSMELFANGVLAQLNNAIGLEADGVLCVQKGDFRRENLDDVFLLAGSGRYDGFGTRVLTEVDMADHVVNAVAETFKNKVSIHTDSYSCLYIAVKDGREIVAFLDSQHPLDDTARDLLEVFATKISIGFENIYLLEQLQTANETLELQIQQRTRELSVANEQLQQLAIHDHLTGIFNRRHLLDRAANELNRAERSGSTLSVMMIDADHFKRINDTHGHG